MGALLVLIVTDSLTSFGVSRAGELDRARLRAASPRSSSTCASCAIATSGSPRSMSRRPISSLPPPPVGARIRARLTRSTTSCARSRSSASARSRGRRTSSSTATTISIAARATATSSASSARTTSASEVFAHIGGHPLGMAFDRKGDLLRLHRRHGPLRRVARQDGHEAHRRDQSQLALGRRRFAPAARRRRSTSRPTDASISARRPSATSRRNGRPTRSRAAATAASSVTIRGTGSTRTIIHKIVFANGVCMSRDGQSFFFAESWTCTIKRYYFDGPKTGKVETVDRQSSGLSGQHQPRVGRLLLGGAARHAHAGA